jgi:membrane protein
MGATSGGFKDKAKARLDAARARWPWLDVTARGFKRFQRDEAPVSAVHIAYSAFFSIFPLLFVAVGVFGLVLRGNPDLYDQILDNLKESLPGGLDQTIGTALDRAQSGAGTSISIGLVLLLYSGTGMIVAIERGLNRAFGSAKAGTFVGQRVRALGWLATVGLLLVVSVALGGAVGGAGNALLELVGISGTAAEVAAGALTIAVSFLLDVVLFELTFVLLPSQAGPSLRQALPGAVGGAVWWGLLKTFGALFVQRSVSGALAVFGPLAAVVGLLVIINVSAQLLLLTASILAEGRGFQALPSQAVTVREAQERVVLQAVTAANGARPDGGPGGAPGGKVAAAALTGWALGRLVPRKRRIR